MKPGKQALARQAPTSHQDLDVSGLFARAQQHHGSGNFADAQACYEKVLNEQPNHVGALHLLGLCEYQTGHHEAAATLVKRALLIDPVAAAPLSDLGVILSELKRRDEALACFDRLIELNPDFPNAYYNRGDILLEMGQFTEAVASFDQAIKINPHHASAFSNRGNALFDLGRFADAVASYDQTIAIAPHHTGALTNRGETLLHLKQPDQALASFEQALSINQQLPEAWLGYAVASLAMEKIDQALAACLRCLALKPDSARALVQLGQCWALKGDTEFAVSFFDRALAIEANNEVALSSKIFSLDCDVNADFAAHQRARSAWWHQIGAKIAADHGRPHQNDRDPKRRIVLGYVSAEFRRSAAAFKYRPVLQNHDKSQFEVVCYSNYPTEDTVTDSFKQAADRWRCVFGWSDDQLAECIRDDKIDILIDLSGHSEGKQLQVFARKPAPVQVTAWGHPTGTGLPTIDYLFSDPISLPSGVRHLFAEQVHDLPCAIMMEPPPTEWRCLEPPVLSKGYMTYGIFNPISRISSAAIRVWSRILRSDGTARLLIEHRSIDDASVRDQLLSKFKAEGIDAHRLCLIEASSREQHLAAYGQVDICLDGFSHDGGVLTWEALYMGVPVVAKLGNGVASRLAGAILAAVGMSDWVAEDDDRYVELALAQTQERLRRIRHELPDQIERRCGPAAYTVAVEQAYRTMWERACEPSQQRPEG
jgi:predicted O-linked N-acetylglucosamine transferase (SPINDLY family)